MPFKHSEDVHQEILDISKTEFESDEDYCLEAEAQDKVNAEDLKK